MTRCLLTIAACTTLANTLAVCVSTVEITPGATEIQLMPAGLFRARDGRPEGIDGWYIDGAIAAQVIALADKRKTPFVIDYDHQTLVAKDTGNPAPAAGWFSRLEWREGDGLYAVDVAWTPKASQYLANQEYRFISPVFAYSKTGQVAELMMAAITNFPAVDGMDEILAAASTRFTPTTSEEELDMDLAKLRKQLGLADDADEAAIFAALSALADKAAAAETQVATLTTQLQQAQSPDPAKFVPVAAFEELKADFAALSTRLTDTEVDDLVADGLASKKLLPSQKDWALSLGKKDVASLRAYLDNAAPIAVLSGTQTQGKKPGEEGYTPEPELVAVCAQFGLDPATVNVQ